MYIFDIRTNLVMLKCDFFRENDVFECSKAVCFQHFLRKSLWCTHQKSSSSQFDYCAVEFVHKICENTMWHCFSNFSQNSTYLLSIFLWNRHVSLTNFQRIVNVLSVLLVDFAQKLYRCFCFFPCLFWNQVSSVLSPPSLLSFTWWTVVAGSHWSYSRESSHRRSTWRGCAHW